MSYIICILAFVLGFGLCYLTTKKTKSVDVEPIFKDIERRLFAYGYPCCINIEEGIQLKPMDRNVNGTQNLIYLVGKNHEITLPGSGYWEQKRSDGTTMFVGVVNDVSTRDGDGQLVFHFDAYSSTLQNYNVNMVEDEAITAIEEGTLYPITKGYFDATVGLMKSCRHGGTKKFIQRAVK